MGDVNEQGEALPECVYEPSAVMTSDMRPWESWIGTYAACNGYVIVRAEAGFGLNDTRGSTALEPQFETSRRSARKGTSGRSRAANGACSASNKNHTKKRAGVCAGPFFCVQAEIAAINVRKTWEKEGIDFRPIYDRMILPDTPRGTAGRAVGARLARRSASALGSLLRENERSIQRRHP